MENERRSISLTNIQAAIDVTGISPIACPFIGTSADRRTPMAYPHPGNRCYRHQVAIKREPQFQRSYCLSENYSDCSIYQHGKLQFDAGAVGKEPLQRSYARRVAVPLMIILFAVAIFISVSFLGWYTPTRASFNLPSTNSADVLPTNNIYLPAGKPTASQLEQIETGEFNRADNAPMQPDSDPAVVDQPPEKAARGGFRAVTYSSAAGQ
jgi:hypothetical protein